MTIQDIENLSVAELKSGREEILTVVGAMTISDVGPRYYQSRLDAKLRDEKLAEQGRTITLLEQGMNAAKEQNELLKLNLTQANANLANVKKQADDWAAKALAEYKDFAKKSQEQLAVTCAEHEKIINDLKAELEKTNEQLAKQTQRGDRLKHQAIRNNQALNELASISNKTIAANQLDNADEVK